MDGYLLDQPECGYFQLHREQVNERDESLADCPTGFTLEMKDYRDPTCDNSLDLSIQGQSAG